ncbi:fumarylacetoacetate hydrolase family protein [Cyanobium sp. Cruz CV13-4-11]|jgi:2-keto-4-pentenoate hydratase/2-oxohepta-3-ene-1,7-dioic acid hydratase in catechol pathway|uniref:fumarylacetoacetate hydrolase family protein n=1 Tax=unclassified Cyanobium TaxID=2627006 RepID=UPI0020CC7E5B|nr:MULTISPECIES: fumarylacetoacetate hydrolase family protein [unclassified Cyanobium]MCP9899838.1 fumarylacetoacetate hydrolase family protein [Cyanobium sp. Cruz CV11-17]MCP9918869.1 fumarylacetoacetate hydrolase family protein [Cyanobium sp. Cruz CV13-4-11]
MKIVRYRESAGGIHHARLDPDGGLERLAGDLFGGLVPTGKPAAVERILAPLEPRAILCIGLNYRRHAAETGAAIPTYPVLFMKSPGAVQHPEAPITLPTTASSHQVDYEGELAVVIGRTCRNVPRSEALKVVLGYTCANDVSARDWQKQPQLGGGQWCRGKSFDSFAPLGPCLVSAAAIPDPQALSLQTRLNGTTVQAASTGDMIFTVAEIIEFLSASTTLLAGTVILTGTPSGVGMAADPPRWLRRGDTVEVEIEAIGVLRNPLIDEPLPSPSPAPAPPPE